MKEVIEIKIDRIVPEGKGVGLYEGKPVYVLGAFPGEIVKVEIYKSKKDFFEGRLVEIIENNPNRIEPHEDHYMSCSPWQSINYKYQIELKKEILLKCFKSLAATEVNLEKFYKSKNVFNYRNKLEFSFTEDEDKKIFLAFHARGSHRNFVKLQRGCQLGQEKINEVSLQILNLINRGGLEKFDLKSLVVRQSNFEGKVISLLLLKNEKERVEKFLEFLKKEQSFPQNLTVALSDYRSPLPKIDKVLFKKGDDFLIEKIGENKFKYYFDSFFQNNIDLFDKSITLIRKFLIQSSKVLELYSGVGSIGISIASKVKQIEAVEIIESAVKAAGENAKSNNIINFKSLLLPAEKIQKELLDQKDVLIIDPPRTGLHPKITEMILEKPPQQIIYLSCNSITQASDYNKLKDIYKIEHLSGFDFYPNTPHMESLVILRKK